MNVDTIITKLTFQLPVHGVIFNPGDLVNLTINPETKQPDGIFHNDAGAWEIVWVQPTTKPDERGFQVKSVR